MAETLIPQMILDNESMVHATCVCCNYQTQCYHVTVCNVCFSDRLKLNRPEREYCCMDMRVRKKKHIGKDGTVSFYKEEYYVTDFGRPSKYPYLYCTCFMCNLNVYSEYSVYVCQTCMNSVPSSYSELKPAPSLVLSTRFPSNTIAPNVQHPGAILDIIPHIASFMYVGILDDEDIEIALETLLNLMEAVQVLIPPRVIIGYIRQNAPKLYLTWHNFLMGMKYDDKYPQVIPPSLGYVCRVTNKYAIPDKYGGYHFKGICDCSLHHEFGLGCTVYPLLESAPDGAWIPRFDWIMACIINNMVIKYLDKHITENINKHIYMNDANSYDDELNMMSPKSRHRPKHHKDVSLPRKHNRHPRKHTSRAGKSKRALYDMGMYSLV